MNVFQNKANKMRPQAAGCLTPHDAGREKSCSVGHAACGWRLVTGGLGLAVCSVWLLFASTASADHIEFSTYFPTDTGTYQRLKIKPIGLLSGECEIGSIYVNNSDHLLYYCRDDGTGNGEWGSLGETWTQNGDNLYPVDNDNPNLKVLISGSSPTEKLWVEDPIRTKGVYFHTDSPTAGINTSTHSDLVICAYDCSAGRKQLVLDPDGNVGIGTDTPGKKLELKNAEPILQINQNDLAGWDLKVENEDLRIIRAVGTGNFIIMDPQKLGIGTTAPEFKLHIAEDGGIWARGLYGSGATLSAAGAGARLIWYPRKGAFRAGYVDGTQWDDASIGSASMGLGKNSLATASFSSAIGDSNQSLDMQSSTLGYGNLANGDYSLAMGKSSSAGNYGFAFGDTADSYVTTRGVALGDHARSEASIDGIAIGSYSWAKVDRAMTIGRWLDVTSGVRNMAIGRGVSNASRLVNAVSDSLMIAFNSTVPTVMVKTTSVGIGVSAPRGALEVVGPIVQAGVQKCPDYVFEPDYKLETIEEHSEFMWREKRLPALSKSEIDENGQEIYELGARRTGILEELEKAHIYIEQLDKRMEELEQKLEKYQKSKPSPSNL